MHKPSNLMEVSAEDPIRDELVPKIKRLVMVPGLSATSSPRLAPRAGKPLSSGIDIVAIGSSTGGPNALAELFAQLPRNLSVPIVIAQHMPPTFTRLLAERLARESGILVEEATDGAVLKAGSAWIAPGNFHMVLSREGTDVLIHLNQDPPENSCRPSADILFRSVEQVYKNRALAVVLTGMGEDGYKGAQTLYDSGAQILAQDEASSVVWGMAGAVANAGIADQILPLGQIASEIIRRSRHGKA